MKPLKRKSDKLFDTIYNAGGKAQDYIVYLLRRMHLEKIDFKKEIHIAGWYDEWCSLFIKSIKLDEYGCLLLTTIEGDVLGEEQISRAEWVFILSVVEDELLITR